MADDVRDSTTGRFVPGHRGTKPKGTANKAPAEFGRLVREWTFGNPDSWQLIVGKVERDLKGDGPATFAIKFLAYGFGEPRQTIEVAVRAEAQRIAEEAGVPVEALMAMAEQLAGGRDAN